MPTISVVILAKNEENLIAGCIKSVKFADEVIVIDDNSDDNTVKIAREHGAEVYKRELDNFADQRNYGSSKTKGDWVLYVDADEFITKELESEILIKLQDDINGYWIPRKNIIFGKWLEHTDWYPDYQLRLLRKGSFVYKRKVHEQVDLKGESEYLVNPILHNNYDTVDQFVKKNYLQYADLEAKILIDEGYVFNWKDLITKTTGEFLRRYFSCKGYRDGVHGLIASMLVSFATFIVYVKVWEQVKNPKENISVKEFGQVISQSGREYRHWLKLAVYPQGVRKIISKVLWRN